MDTSILSQELEPLNAQIEQLQTTVIKLEDELRVVEEELGSFAIDQQHFDILQEACNAIDKLQELDAGKLFWDGLPEGVDASGHSARLRARIAAFSEETRDVKEKRETLQKEIDQHLGLLDYYFDEILQAQEQAQRRQEEFAIEREPTSLPYRAVLMPWSKEVESEKRFRRSLLVSMFWSLLLCIAISWVTVPIPDRANVIIEIPARMAMLLKQEPPMPMPAPVVVPEKPKIPEKVEPEKKAPEKLKKKIDPVKTLKKKPTKTKPAKAKPAGGGTKGTKRKVEKLGVLAFVSDFSDQLDEVPVASLKTKTGLSTKIPGQAIAQRSLVTKQAQGGSSKGISNYGVSRNLGNGGTGGGSGYGNAGQIGGVGTGKVESAMAGLTEEAGRPLSDGMGPGRTDEEIQIVFDRYKATLYRIYNKELRKNPTLRGKLLLRLTIEPGGEVSLCEKVGATDLASPELVTKIIARVKRFNFGPKDDVPPITFTYPIDFLPAG
ncbi:MAG: AgmX/PglI C-terminal domain-containing protein [Thermodesulfobacteriota bacterium]|nr:AgmX/PglI C-terminal domain-containing protein [Thermodesulfobacteriota bacterium]